MLSSTWIGKRCPRPLSTLSGTCPSLIENLSVNLHYKIQATSLAMSNFSMTPLPVKCGRPLCLAPFESAESAFPLADFCLYEKAAPSVIGRRSLGRHEAIKRNRTHSPTDAINFFLHFSFGRRCCLFFPSLPSTLPPPLVTCYYTAAVVSARRIRAKEAVAVLRRFAFPSLKLNFCTASSSQPASP